MADVAQAKRIADCARLIVKFEGKDPEKNYKGNPLWHTKIELAHAIVSEMPADKSVIKFNDTRLIRAVKEYINVFNEGTPKSLGRYVSVEKMPKIALDLHIDALEAAFESLMK